MGFAFLVLRSICETKIQIPSYKLHVMTLYIKEALLQLNNHGGCLSTLEIATVLYAVVSQASPSLVKRLAHETRYVACSHEVRVKSSIVQCLEVE